MKPLGRKAYGSIGHLPGSRMGPADHHVHEGQGIICTTKARDKHDRIIVTEKLDGGNVAVAKHMGSVIALGRAGYLAKTSPFEQHHLFADWVMQNAARFDAILAEGERINGEWLALAHGTRYALEHEPFVVFDMMEGGKRLPWLTILERCDRARLVTARVISDGPPCSIEAALQAIAISGHGAIDPVEGAVWRVERHGQPDFLAKYVRPEKIDGCYLPEITGCEPVWNWRPQ
jgi:hypothetical protein